MNSQELIASWLIEESQTWGRTGPDLVVVPASSAHSISYKHTVDYTSQAAKRQRGAAHSIPQQSHFIPFIPHLTHKVADHYFLHSLVLAPVPAVNASSVVDNPKSKRPSDQPTKNHPNLGPHHKSLPSRQAASDAAGDSTYQRPNGAGSRNGRQREQSKDDDEAKDDAHQGSYHQAQNQASQRPGESAKPCADAQPRGPAALGRSAGGPLHAERRHAHERHVRAAGRNL